MADPLIPDLLLPNFPEIEEKDYFEIFIKGVLLQYWEFYPFFCSVGSSKLVSALCTAKAFFWKNFPAESLFELG